MSPRQLLSVLIAAVAAAVPWWYAAPARAQSPIRHAGDLGPTFGDVDDSCAFEFALYDATAGGSRVSDTISRTLRVRGGLYETDLDFGAETFSGSSRYLEVAVGCPAGKASLTSLTRRAFPGPIRTRTGADAADDAEQPGWAAKAALGTGFTYQGELRSSGSPVTGSGDFQFSLWDAAAGGGQIGATLKTYGVAVDGGRFTTTLDFGASAFDGQARWLEIAVDFPSGTGTFTTLSPRQLISAAPYALQTRGLYVNDAGDVGVGTLAPQARLEVADSGSRAMRVRSTAATGGVALQASAGGGSGWATAIDAGTGSPDGVAAYATSSGDAPTVHIRNDGSGESLRLESRGGGDLLVAHDGAASEDRLRVGGDGITHITELEVTGAYRGTLGPNSGAPFPRPAYDSGWVAIDAGGLVAFPHDIGGSVDDYVVDLQFKSTLPVLGVHNRHFGGAFIGADQADPDFRARGAMWEGLTSSLVWVRREDDDTYSDWIRIRIWVVN